ncbi:DUF6515 family protein [Rubritalea squalenifaciens]|uniref:DUF6515 family protein n=1 Tax=Rubritalea squalenifaciens TaxID=407226 RepID=UPI001160F70F|nr:DUF6515 family protein [Rubritalea squalenifaciens]
MKKHWITLSLAAATALAGLSSCVPIDPYYSGGPGYYGGSGYINSLPPGYSVVHVSGKKYYRHRDVYYDYRNGRYYRISDPHRRSHHDHHSAYRRVVVRGEVYYVRNGVYYKRHNGHYDRVSNPYHSRAHHHPSYKRVIVRGQTYYVRGNQYYRYDRGRYYPVRSPYSRY